MGSSNKQAAQQPQTNDKIPFNQEAEAATIGCVLINPAAYTTLAASLKSGNFFILRHRYIWEAFELLQERGQPIDLLTVIDALKSAGVYQDIGGAAYLTELSNSVPDSSHADVYGGLVKRAAVRRQIMSASDMIKTFAQQEDLTLEQVIAEASTAFFNAVNNHTTSNIVSFRDHVIEEFDRIEQLIQNPKNLLGLTTGFKEINRMLQGFQKRDLIILAGRPGMGKSALLLSMILAIMKEDPNAVIILFSMEMGAGQITQRALSQESTVNLQKLRSGKLGYTDPATGEVKGFHADWGKFVKAAGGMEKYRLFIDDAVGQTPLNIRGTIQRILMEKRRVDLVIVDYLQLMNADGIKPNSNRVLEITQIAQGLKNIAMEFNIPVCSAAQLSRAVEQRQDKRPILSDLRESGGIEQAADVVKFIYRDEEYNEATEFPNQADIIIAKHRNGPTGTVSLYFEKTSTRFMDAAERHVALSRL